MQINIQKHQEANFGKEKMLAGTYVFPIIPLKLFKL